MDARAGENDTPTKLGNERINIRLNTRKETIQKNYSKPELLPPYKMSKHFPQQ